MTTITTNGGPDIGVAVAVSAAANGTLYHLKREGPGAGFENSAETGGFVDRGKGRHMLDRIACEGIQPANRKLDEHAVAIRALSKQTFQNIAEIGRRLNECRAILKQDGGWQAWLKNEFEWSDQQARRFIHVYEQAPKLNKLLSRNFDFPISALYLLAAPKTPEAARTEIAERVQAGEVVSVDEVKRTIATAKGLPPREASIGEDSVTALDENTAREQGAPKIGRRASRKPSPADIAENALIVTCQACANLDDMDASIICQVKRPDLPAMIDESVAILLRHRDQLCGEENKTAQPPVVNAPDWWKGLSVEERRQFFDDTPLVEILAALTPDKRSELERRCYEHLSALQLITLLERRLERDGIDDRVQLQMIRDRIETHRPPSILYAPQEPAT
jgi:Protein of unknown function (DUF3102)